jgi:hypothetical protein
MQELPVPDACGKYYQRESHGDGAIGPFLVSQVQRSTE